MRGEDGCTTLTAECKNQCLDYSLKLHKFREMAVVNFPLGFIGISSHVWLPLSIVPGMNPSHQVGLKFNQAVVGYPQ